MREKVRKFLAHAGIDEMDAELLVLAIDEACTNVIRHAYEGVSGRPVNIELTRTPCRLRIRLRDYGKCCDPEHIKGRQLSDVRPGGLGVHLIKQAFDEVCYQPMSRGTRLILTKRLRRR